MVALDSKGAASALILAFFGLCLAGCKGCDDDSTASQPTETNAKPAPSERVLTRLIDDLHRCDVDHRGPFVDLGATAMYGRFGFRTEPPRGIQRSEHDSSTWAEVYDRTLTLSFFVAEPRTAFVGVRALGRDSRQAYVTLDDTPLGTLSFGRGLVRTAETPVTTLPLDAGLHTVTLRFLGPSRNEHVPFAELDWVRLGFPDDETTTFGAPTIADLVTASAVVGGQPRRAVALRASSAIRCGFEVPDRAALHLSLGLEGGDEARAEVALRIDGQERVVLAETLVNSRSDATWTELNLDLSPYQGKLVTLELATPPGFRRGRVLFAEPRIVVPTIDPPVTPKARAVVVVVLDGVEPGLLPPWKGQADSALPTLSSLVLGATVVENLRAPTSFVSSTFASILTGLPPRAHAHTDLSTALPEGTSTVATVARDAAVHTAMFTGVPTTFRAFGFDAGWERFGEYPPQSGSPATAPLDDAAAWITEVTSDAPNARLLLAVHARGAHPPWDLTSREATALPPTDYAGALEPRRSAQLLAKARQRGPAKVLAPEDLERARALAGAALTQQDAALRRIIEALTGVGLWDQTLFVVMGDVSSALNLETLYGDGLPLSEPLLHTPLYVHFPGDLFGGGRIRAPVEVYDVAATTAAALDLHLDNKHLGRDLAAIAANIPDGISSARIATVDDRYASRLGDLVLNGRSGKSPSLCDLSVDPTCAFDRRSAMPLATQWLFRAVVERETTLGAPPEKRRAVMVDLDTDAALRVWGAVSD